MVKLLFTLILSTSFFLTFAQKKDTSVYYVTKSGKTVSTKDSADYIAMILPPDTSIDKNLSIIREYYKNGKIRLIGTVKSNDFKFQGPAISFFPNGHKLRVANYENGLVSGDVTEYYPNGKFYNLKSYTKDNRISFNECKDSTGRVLVSDGSGIWREYLDDKYDKNYIEGEVTLGLQQGQWKGITNDTSKITVEYKDGSRVYESSNDMRIFTAVESAPEFQGGINQFYIFIARNIRYPSEAQRNNTQGRVIVNFVVEENGTLTNIKVIHGIGNGCDEEAVRIIKLSSSLWKPGMQNGKPVRVSYTVPIGFTLAN